jgi:hypothetical protein
VKLMENSAKSHLTTKGTLLAHFLKKG